MLQTVFRHSSLVQILPLITETWGSFLRGINIKRPKHLCNFTFSTYVQCLNWYGKAVSTTRLVGDLHIVGSCRVMMSEPHWSKTSWFVVCMNFKLCLMYRLRWCECHGHRFAELGFLERSTLTSQSSATGDFCQCCNLIPSCVQYWEKIVEGCMHSLRLSLVFVAIITVPSCLFFFFTAFLCNIVSMQTECYLHDDAMRAFSEAVVRCLVIQLRLQKGCRCLNEANL